MLINEIFNSIEGEGMRTGYLTTFIRTFSCNLECSYCFGIKPGRHIPLVHSVRGISDEKRITKKGRTIQGASIPLNMVKVGDELFTYDDQLNVVTTTVKGVVDREVTEWYEINLGGTEYFVTPEHPIFTTSGMKQAKDLKVGDLILHTNQKTLNSMRMTINNPMFDLEVAQKSSMNTNYVSMGKKLSKTIQEKKKNGTYKSTWELLNQTQKDELCKNSSMRMLRENNPNWIENYPYRNYTDLKKAITNNPEQFHCERCGVSGEEKTLCVHHINKSHEDDSIDNLAVVCTKCHNQIHERGYNFWNGNRKDGKENLMAVSNANGIEVKSIKHVDITEHKYYGRPYGPKALHVYNLSCAPYNTYFLDTMWVHNCDSKYACIVDENEENQYTTMTVEEIVAECDRIGNLKVTLTGGEPLIQRDAPELVAALLEIGYEVNIETNGAVELEPFEDRLTDILSDDGLLRKLIYTLDYKCPSSGMEDRMILSNIPFLIDNDVLKFVVGNTEDLDAMKSILNQYNPQAEIFVSPVWGEIEGKDIVQYMKDNDLQRARVQVQLHKIFYPVDMRGV